MNGINRKNFQLIFPAIILLLVSPAFMELSAQTISQDSLKIAAQEIMTTARYCALITRDNEDNISARAMDAFPPEADLTVWMATNPLSRKVAQIREQPAVTLYYFNADMQAYVTLYGQGELVNDSQAKRKHWKEEWTAFYPDREKGYLLIKVIPERVEVVSEAHGIIGDLKTWTPPSINISTEAPEKR